MDQLSYTVEEAAKLTRVCRTRLYQEINESRLRARKIGRSTRLLHADVAAWLNSLPAA